MKKQEFKDKVAGAVYGFMIGDAMGATTEFMDAGQVKEMYPDKLSNIVGGGCFDWEAGDCTDDTQMTACIMNVISDCPFLDNMNSSYFKNMVAEEFVKWYKSNPKDIGNACRRGIKSYIDGSFIDEDDTLMGNGALMRAMPCALVDRDDLNVAQAEITHFNEDQFKVIIAYSKAIRSYILGVNPCDISEGLKKPLGASQDLREPTGHVGDTFINSIYWSSKNSFKECIIGAVNDGGDADTIAAIAGSLSGARFGLHCIPGRWLKQLKPEWKYQAGKFINYVTNLRLSVYGLE